MSDVLPSKQVFIIQCSTGCSCCSSENHWRGPYKTHDAASRRIAYFRAPDSKFWPVASQFSSRGNYTVRKAEMEMLPDGRALMMQEVLSTTPEFIVVKADGTVADNAIEQMELECY